MRNIALTFLGCFTILAACSNSDDAEKPVTPVPTGDVTIYATTSSLTRDLTRDAVNFSSKDNLYDGLVSGAAALHALGYDVNYADMVDRFEVYYRTPNGTVGGYGSQTNGTTGSGTLLFIYGYARRACAPYPPPSFCRKKRTWNTWRCHSSVRLDYR